MAWLSRCGADVLAPKANEYVRFVAGGVLHLAYQNAAREVTSWVPAAGAEVRDAFLAGESPDLGSGPHVHVEDWRATGIALFALGARDQSGEVLDLAACAAELGIAVPRLERSLAAQRSSAAKRAASRV